MYKIEITADTLAELAGKTATLAAKLNADTDGIWWQKTDAPQKLKKALDVAFEQEVAEAAAVDPTHAPEPQTSSSAPSTLASDISNGQPSAQDDPEAHPSAPASPSELNFDTDVAPYVLQVVKEKGKPVAQEILSQFGVEKASLLEPHLWPELVDQLKGAL